MAFKQKMVQRLTGKNAVSATQLSKETGVRQQSLSRWLQEARNLPLVSEEPKPTQARSVSDKARILAEAAELAGDQLAAYLERAGVKLADYERWRQALEEGGQAAIATSRRIRSLERELARKEKALAEAAALLVLKKKWRVSMGRTRTTARTRRANHDPDRDHASSGRWRSPYAGVPYSGDLGQDDRALAT